MATLNEIKNRISGVRSTKKITNAMYLISSVKMRKARADLERRLQNAGDDQNI
jgi:F-type H+-transporting ATPase subunit gamma